VGVNRGPPNGELTGKDVVNLGGAEKAGAYLYGLACASQASRCSTSFRLFAKVDDAAARKPVSAPTSWFMAAHMRRLSMLSGISAESRPIVRHQPQFRLDCSPADASLFAQRHGDTFLARWRAALTPMIPRQRRTTSARWETRPPKMLDERGDHDRATPACRRRLQRKF